MDNDVKDYIKNTNKKLAKIEKKIQEMKSNLLIMSFHSDMRLIEDTLFSYQAQGMKITKSLFEKIEKFKILLQSKQDIKTIGTKFLEVTEEFYRLRKQFIDNDLKDQQKTKSKKNKGRTPRKESDDFLLAYI